MAWMNHFGESGLSSISQPLILLTRVLMEVLSATILARIVKPEEREQCCHPSSSTSGYSWL